MIEKVARALAYHDYDTEDVWESHVSSARAAIEAMLKPSDAMWAAADDRAKQAKELGWPLGTRELLKQYIWADMINAALISPPLTVIDGGKKGETVAL